jgi:hypothetical protein
MTKRQCLFIIIKLKRAKAQKNKKKCLKSKKKTEESYNEKNLPTQEKTT